MNAFKDKEDILAPVRAAAFSRFCKVMDDATHVGADTWHSARNVGPAYVGFARASRDADWMFDTSPADVTGNAELPEALTRARHSLVSYASALIDDGILAGDAHNLGRLLWAAAHGLVMLRLSGVIAGAADLRQPHEKTMSALVRGAHAPKPVTPGPAC